MNMSTSFKNEGHVITNVQFFITLRTTQIQVMVKNNSMK